jgi:hypothetical protein
LNAMKLKKINHHSWINLVSFFTVVDLQNLLTANFRLQNL